MSAEQGYPAEEIDTSRPHPARMYDYYLGGWDNYEVDREAAQRVVDALPDIVPASRANRRFLQRAVRLVAESGIRQIVDIGTGIPTSPNTHEVAQAVRPDIRVAYVDNDPIVGTHADARLAGNGNTGFFLADLRDPRSILEHPALGKLIDFDEPVAVMLVAVMHFISDEDGPKEIVATLRDAMPAGSHLVMSHATAEFHQDSVGQVSKVYENATATLHLRPRSEILALLDGFELLDPGLVQIPLWRPDGEPPTEDEVRRNGFYGAVGRKG